MIHEPKTTFAGQVQGRPLNMYRPITEMTCAEVATAIEQFMSGQPTTINPQTAAIEFYLLEHAAGQVKTLVDPHAPLAQYQTVLERYNTRCSLIALRSFYYLLMICAREARHAHQPEAYAPMIAQMMGNSIPPHYVTLVKTFVDTDTSDVTSVTKILRSTFGSMELGKFVTMIQLVFKKGKFSSSYGGPKWAVVAECLRQFVFGETTAAMMLDTVWTLSHNTAPIFNKLLVFAYQDKGHLLEVLDIQRSGQIPNLVMTHETYASSQYVTPELRQLAAEIGAVLGAPFISNTKVDWALVKALGAVGTYSYGGKAKAAAAKKATNAASLFPGFAVEKAPRHGAS